MTNENNSDDFLNHARQLGQKLREGREARGLSIRQVAEHQKLTSWYIERIENGQLDGLAAPVYLKGFIRRYGVLVDVDCEETIKLLEARDSAVPLPAEGLTAPPIRRAIYTRAATVVAGTAMVVAPLIWWANHNNRDWSLKGMVESPVAEQSNTLSTQTQADTGPVAASLQPMPTRAAEPVDVPPTPVISAQDLAAEETTAASTSLTATQDGALLSTDDQSAADSPMSYRSLSIELSDEAWVELSDGTERLEYNLLPAGTQRSYQFSGELSAKIGNASAVRVVVDGVEFEAERFTRDNVLVFSLDQASDTAPDMPSGQG